MTQQTAIRHLTLLTVAVVIECCDIASQCHFEYSAMTDSGKYLTARRVSACSRQTHETVIPRFTNRMSTIHGTPTIILNSTEKRTMKTSFTDDNMEQQYRHSTLTFG